MTKMLEMSRICDDYGVDVWIWYPALDEEYPDPFGDQTPVSWKSWAGSLFDAPLKVHYSALDTRARHKICIVYSGDSPRINMRLTCNGDSEVQALLEKPWPPRPLEFDIPVEATAQGELTLSWNREPGLGNNGRGCQVSEIWIIKK